MNRRFKWSLLGLLALGFILFNVVAYNQAWSMSHLVEGGAGSVAADKIQGLEKLKVLFFGPRLLKRPNERDPSALGLRFETMRFQGGQGTELEAWALRAKQPGDWILGFHGYAANKAQLLDPAAEFVKLGWNVLLVDLTGHGGSGGDRTTIGYDEGRDVAASLDYSRQKLGAGKLVLFGVSMGAASALRAVHHEGAKADGMILECPFDRFPDTVRNRFKLMHVPAFPAAEVLLFWGSLQVGGNLFSYSLSGEAEGAHCPALVMAGEHDQRAKLSDVTSVYEHLAGPKQLVVFNAGHQAFQEADPALWHSKVQNFLKSL